MAEEKMWGCGLGEDMENVRMASHTGEGKNVYCGGVNCLQCGFWEAEAMRRRVIRTKLGLTTGEDGLKRLVIR